MCAVCLVRSRGDKSGAGNEVVSQAVVITADSVRRETLQGKSFVRRNGLADTTYTTYIPK